MDWKQKTRPRTEVLQRYCPHVGENVVLLRTVGAGEAEFSCLRADHCEKRALAACIDVKSEKDTRT